MTFHYIYISAADKIICKDVTYGVHVSFGMPRFSKIGAFGEKTYSWERLSLCGIYSKLSTFSHQQNTTVTVNIYDCVLHDIKLSYSVIDKGRMRSVPTEDIWSSPKRLKREWQAHITTQVHLWAVRITGTHFKATLNVHRVFASKIEIITIKPTNFTGFLEIYDGPGTLSSQLKLKNGVYTTSSCPALIQYYFRLNLLNSEQHCCTFCAFEAWFYPNIFSPGSLVPNTVHCVCLQTKH